VLVELQVKAELRVLAPQSERTGMPVEADWAAKLDLGPMPESVEPAVSVAKVAAVEMVERAATVEQVANVAGVRGVGQADRVA
jgi:hypothetical protein